MRKPNIILTASNMSALSTCARKFYLAYELGWRKRETSDALRFGTAFHAGLEARANGKSFFDALNIALATAGADEFDEQTAAKIDGLLRGYYARWMGDEEAVAEFTPEVEFCIPFTGRGVMLAGKIDGVVRLKDGRRGIIEHKTTSEDISWGSAYWEDINRNQIALYGIAREAAGDRAEVYLYDVIRKPTIRQTQKETAQEFAVRLAKDCMDERPDYYFARREIPLLDCDRLNLARHINHLVRYIRWMRKEAAELDRSGENPALAWHKCGSLMVCRGCPFRGVCDSQELPDAFDAGRRFEELTIVHKYL